MACSSEPPGVPLGKAGEPCDAAHKCIEGLLCLETSSGTFKCAEAGSGPGVGDGDSTADGDATLTATDGTATGGDAIIADATTTADDATATGAATATGGDDTTTDGAATTTDTDDATTRAGDDIGGDDATGGDDTTAGGDDTTSSGGDDTTTGGGDDTTSSGDDTTGSGDTTGTGDDTTGSGDDTTSGGDDTTTGDGTGATGGDLQVDALIAYEVTELDAEDPTAVDWWVVASAGNAQKLTKVGPAAPLSCSSGCKFDPQTQWVARRTAGTSNWMIGTRGPCLTWHPTPIVLKGVQHLALAGDFAWYSTKETVWEAPVSTRSCAVTWPTQAPRPWPPSRSSPPLRTRAG